MPDFYHISLAGQGYPFDNLQASAIWIGTPLYVISLSKDKAWALVLTPDAYHAWVKVQDLAYTSDDFIFEWQKAAKKGLVAVTKTETSIIDLNGFFQSLAYIGTIFPLFNQNKQNRKILIPIKNCMHEATITIGVVDRHASCIMPLEASSKNFIKIIQQLINRQYGWCGLYFLNDCSQEMKSIFTVFGIWLPRGAKQMSELGSVLDLSFYTVNERLNLLKQKGRPFFTLIYVGGHIILYVGNKNNQPISYQNGWGFSVRQQNCRYIYGKSVFLPLLASFPELPELIPHAALEFFRLIYLDDLV